MRNQGSRRVIVNNRDDARAFFFAVWRKLGAGALLDPMENIVATVIREHPEYHHYLEHESDTAERDFDGSLGESNPFLHMGLHIALHEQLQADRPRGILALYHQMTQDRRFPAHDTEHRIIECLAECLYTAQQQGALPDEKAYLERVEQLVRC